MGQRSCVVNHEVGAENACHDKEKLSAERGFGGLVEQVGGLPPPYGLDDASGIVDMEGRRRNVQQISRYLQEEVAFVLSSRRRWRMSRASLPDRVLTGR